MKKTITLIFMLLVCGLWAFAQQSYPSQSSTSSPSQSSASSQSQTSSSGQTPVRGCLSGSAGNYTLTSDSGQKYQLAGDTSKLADHVGHEVEITGTTAASSTASSTGSAASNTSGSSSETTLNVSKVKHISTSCSSSSGTMQH